MKKARFIQHMRILKLIDFDDVIMCY